MPNESDLLTPLELGLLDQVLQLALRARQLGHHPFAALVADAQGQILSQALNGSSKDRTAHAEMLALSQASQQHSPEQLRTATLYSSAEPCAMCAAGAYWSGVGRVVYALSEARLLQLTGNDPENPTLSLPCRHVFAAGQRPMAVVGPLREEQASLAHVGFWHPQP